MEYSGDIAWAWWSARWAQAEYYFPSLEEHDKRNTPQKQILVNMRYIHALSSPFLFFPNNPNAPY